MSECKFDIVLQFGQLDMSSWMASKYLSNEHYGIEIIKHNVTAEEAKQYVVSQKWKHIDKKMKENSHVKDFNVSCFWTIAEGE